MELGLLACIRNLVQRLGFWAMCAQLLGISTSSQAQTLKAFNPDLNGGVTTAVFQDDGKIILAGDIGSLGTQSLDHVTRLFPDGSLDNRFTAGTGDYNGGGNTVNSLALQADQKIVVAGNIVSVGGQPCNAIARLREDGTLDTAFDIRVDNPWSLALLTLPDHKILIGGMFSTMNGQPKGRIALLNEDGSFDPDFKAEVGSGHVACLAAQPDGRFLLGGSFQTVNGQAGTNLVRIFRDGSLDAGFKCEVNCYPTCMAVQADGKILVAGSFPTSTGVSGHIGRLNPDGSRDTSFNPLPDKWVYAVLLQADGKILVGGEFTNIAGITSKAIARLNPDGTPDTSFQILTPGSVSSLALSRDGDLLLNGYLPEVNNQPRRRLALLSLSEPATEDFHANGSTLTWLRGGSSPELQQVTFDLWSPGTGWSALGRGIRIPGGWELVGASFPPDAILRSCGWGSIGKSSWSISSVLVSGTVEPAIVEQPHDLTVNLGTVARFTVSAFGSPPLSFQWKKDGRVLADSARISGTQTAELTLSSVLASDAGEYSVSVSNALGSVTSRAARLKVNELFITSQPRSLALSAGTEAVFAVTVGGNEPITCQWWKDGAMLPDGNQVSGATTASLLITNLLRANEGSYWVVASNDSGSLTSAVATLTVRDPAILVPPANLELDPLSTATFRVVAAGTPPLSFQWVKSTTPIPGATNDTLTLNEVKVSDAGFYRVYVANAFGTVSNEPQVRLYVFSPTPKYLRVLTNPISQYVLKGSDASLSVAAEGVPPVSIQWYYATNGPSTSQRVIRVPFATNETVLLTNLTSSRSVWAVISNAYGTINSGSAGIVVKTNLDALDVPAEPLAATGWNRDVVLENQPQPTFDRNGFDYANYFWSEVGFMEDHPRAHNLAGLPSDGRIRSLADSNVVFQLQPYDQKNSLWVYFQNKKSELTLTPPVRLQTLSLLGAVSHKPGCTIGLTFTDGSSTNLQIGFHDWWEGNEFLPATRRPAIASLGRFYHASGQVFDPDYSEYMAMMGFSLDHFDIDLRGTEFTNKFLAKLTLQLNTSNTAGLLAVSGSVLEAMALPRPVLSITPEAAMSSAVLSWSSSSTNCLLEQTTALQGTWSPLSDTPQVSQDTNYSLRIPLESTNRFYRLRLY